MTIQDTIIEALKASQVAHRDALATIEALAFDKATLHAQVNSLTARVAHLEAESVKIVEPDSVQSLVAALADAVAETHAAVRQSAPNYKAASEAETATPTPPPAEVTPPTPAASEPSPAEPVPEEAPVHTLYAVGD